MSKSYLRNLTTTPLNLLLVRIAEQKLYSMKMDFFFHVEVMVPNTKKKEYEDKFNFPGMLAY